MASRSVAELVAALIQSPALNRMEPQELTPKSGQKASRAYRPLGNRYVTSCTLAAPKTVSITAHSLVPSRCSRGSEATPPDGPQSAETASPSRAQFRTHESIPPCDRSTNPVGQVIVNCVEHKESRGVAVGCCPCSALYASARSARDEHNAFIEELLLPNEMRVSCGAN